ncbi:MAG: hypothetical protein V2I32_09980 [Desulforhopalus sp.]|jgi:hypothetical protein|nr:hypothetical protein [Desulforhopalus sp.]
MTKNFDDEETKDAIVEKAQRLRLRRFWMSVATYFVALLATFLITQLGIGGLSGIQWKILIGWCVFGICLFFILFYTNVNLRFTEPSLTREQIVYSSFYGTLAMFWLPEARPIIFLFVLAPFSFGMLILTFRQFLTVAVWLMAVYAGMLTFDYFIYPQDFDFKYQIFLFSLFSLILIWFAFFGGFVSNLRSRLWAQKEALKKVNEELQKEIQDREKAQFENERLIGELKESLLKVRTLEGIIPICMHCKEIRDDKGAWNQLEKYISENSEAQFSHSICEKCRNLYYPEYQK